MGTSLAMGKDHPIAWWRCAGKGRVLYTAGGHTAATFAEPDYRQLLAGAINWAMKQEGEACGTAPAAPRIMEAKP